MSLLSIILFDCSQFITFNLIASSFDEKLLNDFFNQGFEILINDKIEQRKRTYLQEYLNSFTIEFIKKEFLGEFEEWKEKENTPEEVLKFSENIERLINSRYIKNLKIIIVEYADENRNNDFISLKQIAKEKIKEGLFCASKWCFEEWGNIMIFEVN